MTAYKKAPGGVSAAWGHPQQTARHGPVGGPLAKGRTARAPAHSASKTASKPVRKVPARRMSSTAANAMVANLIKEFGL